MGSVSAVSIPRHHVGGHERAVHLCQTIPQSASRGASHQHCKVHHVDGAICAAGLTLPPPFCTGMANGARGPACNSAPPPPPPPPPPRPRRPGALNDPVRWVDPRCLWHVDARAQRRFERQPNARQEPQPWVRPEASRALQAGGALGVLRLPLWPGGAAQALPRGYVPGAATGARQNVPANTRSSLPSLV